MTIAVIIPTLNEERHLPLALERLAAMAFEEIIVVDGGSQDRTLEIIADFGLSIADCPQSPIPNRKSQIRLLTAPPGRARQMNAGAAATHGEVLLFLHADTSLPREACREIERVLQDPGCVGGRFDVRFEQDTGWGWMISRLMNLRSRLTGICTGDQAIFVRRSVFERLGGFAELPLMEDLEFSRRLKAAGRVAALRAKVVTSYRRWATSGPIRTIILMWALRLLYWLGVSPRRLAHLYGEIR
jgi:rSAM/selenodomain-associated transferase 2